VNAVIDEKKQLFKNIQSIPFNRSETIDVVFRTSDSSVTVTEWMRGSTCGTGNVLVPRQSLHVAERKSHAGGCCIIM
jgi:hypothetical protein